MPRAKSRRRSSTSSSNTSLPDMNDVRVRFPPSPTGYCHVGTARMAIVNYLFARKHGGRIIFRSEETDRERSSQEFEDDIKESIKWLGLDWDEFYRQSERTEIYRKEIHRLIADGKAFVSQEDSKKEPGKNVSVIRLRNPGETIEFDDVIRGKITFNTEELRDFVIARAEDDPLYHLAVVVDDAEMKISHVIRGEDHISNTPKQILIYEALGYPVPLFAHLPLILGSDRSKLSKRHGGTATLDYKKEYLPEALINFLGSLGYNFSKEIISKDEMIGEFELSKVHKSGAIFDVKKLNWINSQYIKRLSTQTFKQLINLEELSDDAVPLITERLEKLSDIVQFEYLWKVPVYDKELLKWKKADLEKSIGTLTEVKKIID